MTPPVVEKPGRTGRLLTNFSWLAGGRTSGALLSLAGIPLTAGFIGKFYLMMAGVDASLWALLLALVVGSAIGIIMLLPVLLRGHMDMDNNRKQ